MEQEILYKCDPKKNKECRKMICQTDCFFAKRKDCSCDGKSYHLNLSTMEFEEVSNE